VSLVRRFVSVEVRREFWRLIKAGLPPSRAALAVGVSLRQGQKWFRDAGGMSPVALTAPSPRFLSADERDTIALEVAAGTSQAQIARMLGRRPSTISRELKRNRSLRDGRYRPSTAQYKAEARRRRPKPSKLAANTLLRELVQAKLTAKHSPEQIAAQLAREFPDDESMQLSHESIYRSIYVQGRGELRRELAKCLRTGRALRRPRGRVDGRANKIPNLVAISERPPEADDRAVPGHWEGDLIIGANSRSAIGTLVERSTRFLMLLHLPGDHGAEAVRDAVIAAMGELPEHLRRSLAWDRGSEMTRHSEITVATDVPVYFCDPASPWQRGSNENTNGLLRQYFAKGIDLSIFPKDYLDYVAAQMNSRPRKTLGWDTPAERLNALLSDPTNGRVATTG
jgi:transposase, IS30 family